MNRSLSIVCMLLVVVAVISVMSVNGYAASEPEVTVDNYTVKVTEADSIRDMRYAPGIYNTTSEIKAAEGNVALSEKIVADHTADGIFTYEMPKGGYYTLWIRMKDGTNYIKPLDVTHFTPYVSAYGVKITVHNLYDVKDVFIAKGEYSSYREIKDNGYIVSVSASKIGTKHDYTYTVYDPGVHTVLIRYNDGTQKLFHETLTVDEPVFIENGLQLIISNLPDVKVIRTAYGEWNTVKELKATDTIRNFSSKTAIKGKDPYTIQYRTEGRVTIIVEYNNGYVKVYHYDVHKKVPVVTQDDDSVTFTELDGLLNIRYAKGEYTDASQIKNAPGSIKIKPNEITDGSHTLTLDPGVYTFCVQYDDESYNYYVITVESKEPTATGIHLSNAFSDGMILQRDEPLSVWGTADPSSGIVRVDFGGEYATVKVDEYGNWKVTFKNTFSYTTRGQTLTVTGGDGSAVLKDILVGDTYFLIGQSNVYYSMGHLSAELKTAGRSDELVVDYNDDRNIRFYRVSSNDYKDLTGSTAQGTDTVFTDIYNGGYWMKPSDVKAQVEIFERDKDTAASDDGIAFSALGYMFAYNMSSRSDVPVGVIEIDASGCPLISFAPNDLADKWGHDVLGKDGTYHYKLAAIEDAAVKTRFVYNQQINPFTNFSTAGIIWYQGESDHLNTREIFGAHYENTFADQFAELMTYYRSVFGNGDFPVYMIELPVCYYNNGANVYIETGGVRAEMGTVPQKLDNCYIASSSDLWFDAAWWNNIHPPIKHLNAYRLTDIVMADKFGEGDIHDVCGPVLADVEYVGRSKAYLTFDHAGSALTTADGSGYVKGLEIFVNVNGSGQWIEHEGRIITGTDRITVDAGSFELWGVRYGRSTEASHPHVRNLCNSYKMPAIAFVDFNVKEYFDFTIDSSGWDIYTPDRVTGYDYRYGPSVIDHGNGSMDAWFSCTGSNESDELDYFTHKHSDDGGRTWTKEKIVLSPTGLSEDRLSVCDPGAIYFDGYYYLGYTSTLDKAGYSNHVFVARSKDPEGPYEKWDGSTWGELPSPLVTYNGHGDQWGMGEVSFVKVEDTIYIYYSLKCETGQYTLVSTADATNENWPSTVQYKGVALNWGPGQAAADVKYDRHTGKFIAMSIVNSNTDNCYMALYTSDDGFNFTESGRAYTNMKAYSMNNGLSAGPDGTFDSSKDKLYIAYAYGSNWGCWATRMAPITLKLTKSIDLNRDRGANDPVMYTPINTDRYTMGITTDPHYYIINSGDEFRVNPYRFDDKMGRYAITDTENISFSEYDESIVAFDGVNAKALKAGRTIVTMTYKDEFYVTFTVDVREKGIDVSSAGIYSWTPWSEVINISRSNMKHSYMIKGIAETYAGTIGEAFNDPLDKAIFDPWNYPVTYSGYDTRIISVNNMGVITPLAQGSTEVTVTICGGKSFTVRVNVVE